MKMKKLMFTASSLAVGASLVGGILTSCSKATVDEKNKIDLNDDGAFCTKETAANFKQALKDALSRSGNWAQFKAALADEIVYRWYVDRAAENKDSTTKNATFRVNLDEWTDKINKDYDETIKNLKNKYTDKWEFYLQNEILDPVGGTEASYKHAKLVEKVRTEFLSKVFATNYFGHKTGNPKGDQRSKYPAIYTPASLNISGDTLQNPDSWKDLGFFARTNSSFAISDDNETVDGNYLAKNPDGDYATIQAYVFERWFLTEKPFFSAASLFKYSNPKYCADTKLSGIYNGVSTGVKIPDNPNEAFPFFGAYPSSDSAKGINAYIAWYKQLLKDNFDTPYRTKVDGKEVWKTNETIKIKKEYTEDSQTLLLSFGSQMIGGSANALYIPYANAAASLYMQMITGDETYAPVNTHDQKDITDNLNEAFDDEGKQIFTKDNAVILKNFMYSGKTAPTNINSYVDLAAIYPSGVKSQDIYHCPLFKADKDYTFLWGKDATVGEESGVRYVTNAFQVKLGKGTYDSAARTWTYDTTSQQPWIFELNESGMHAQTIDGYRYVNKQTSLDAKKEALKEVLKYRLMQKKCGYDATIISGDIFGDSGKLKSYFSDNFTNIILEMALSEDAEMQQYNIFRAIDTYKESTWDSSKLFLTKVVADEKLTSIENIKEYIRLTNSYDISKKYIDAFETANSKTYAYRTKQMENARTQESHLTIYENGLLAPLPYKAEAKYDGVNQRLYNTSIITVLPWSTLTEFTIVYTRDGLLELNNKIKASGLLTSIDSLAVNADSGLSPQVSTAKSKTSNRFWYKSYLVDKMMYTYMSNKEGMANFIKGSAMEKYISKTFGDSEQAVYTNEEMLKAFITTYCESKLFTTDKNYASYASKDKKTANDFYEALFTAFTNQYNYKIATSGAYCDDYLNFKTYLATVAYLIGKDKNFENFYKTLNNKISEDEMALVGYINKTNKNIFGAETVNAATKSLATGTSNAYEWTPEVANIYDDTHYTDGSVVNPITDAKIACDQYWKVINKHVGNTGLSDEHFFAGFTGIQTKSSNQLDSASKLQAAAFENFAKCTDRTRILSNADKITDPTFFIERDTEKLYEENYGCWFAYAGTHELNSKGESVTYTFNDVKYGETTIKADQFKLKDGSIYPAIKLAKKIAEYRSVDDLRDLAKKLGAAFYGDSKFRQIGDGTSKFDTADQLKVEMLQELLKEEGEGEAKQKVYLKCFQRMTDAELHEEGSDYAQNKDYGFTDDKGNTYRILFTQINKSDVTEKNFAPTWKDNNWTANEKSPIQIQEFWYILATMATESSIQQQAISDVVKTVYGDDKLVVYDAQLYNCFDSVWIKDWSKKTMGA